ncbi:uncharacterized protein LOC135341195 [Halichondria panicea]|uniref:uncharacterized protein LOC135341195 n=1 Tax=Halichondria panicea TaxID=6063 RepID=UPI00312B5158
MSYSRAKVVHSSTTSSRPKARQQSRQYPGKPMHAMPPASEDSGQLQEEAPTVGERSLESRGAHYVLTPQSSKNSKLKSTAQTEVETYRQHKKQKRERVAEMLHEQKPETLGGVKLKQNELGELRRRQEEQQKMDAKFEAVRQRQKREKYQQEKKQREDEEFQRMKQVQREKGERLKEKQEAQHLENLEEIRKKRLARFEN